MIRFITILEHVFALKVKVLEFKKFNRKVSGRNYKIYRNMTLRLSENSVKYNYR